MHSLIRGSLFLLRVALKYVDCLPLDLVTWVIFCELWNLWHGRKLLSVVCAYDFHGENSHDSRVLSRDIVGVKY